MSAVLNVSGYRFAALDALPARRAALLLAARDRGLRGTVLLAEEGINLVLAGAAPQVHDFLRLLRSDAQLAGLEAKESWSDAVPFGRLLVKIKREIIRMNRPAVRPAQGRAPAVDAATLKRWLDSGHDDAGRPVVLLDTRNGFEVDHGGFAGAVDWRLAKFSDFPAALQAHRAALQGKTVVSYCTGGIRCEKAALHMLDAGLETVYQLEGGILRYFEQVGSAHFRGHCFVFDQRVALAADLRAP